MFNPHWTEEQLRAIQLAALTNCSQIYLTNNELQQQQALMLNGNPIANIPVSIPNNVHCRNDSDDSAASEDEDTEEQRTLFIANMDERVTDELLYEIFINAGPIESVRIPKDSNGRRRAFAFITFVHACTPPYAMQLFQGIKLFYRTLVIKHKGKSTAPSPAPQQQYAHQMYEQAHPLLSDSAVLSQQRHSSDNSALRFGNNFQMQDPSMNPFKHTGGTDWTRGSAGGTRGAPRNLPYDRHPRSDGSRNRETYYEDQQRNQRHHHNNKNNNRRSEQRSEYRRK